ncbi:MAG: alpha/beta fold hydrolase [Alphaproteobacteria bacterium]|nr:alpha/beta fold hydrolase [Alphaproteobacteria bacterium]
MSATPLFKVRHQGGSGPQVLLLHGFGSDALSWGGNLPALLPLASVHTVELPAHGSNPSLKVDLGLEEFALQLRQDLLASGVGPAHFVGHSLGAAFAIALAATVPEAVRSLSLIAPLGLGHGVDHLFLHALLGAHSAEEGHAVLQRLFVRQQLASLAFGQRLVDHLNKTGIRAALRALSHLMQHWEGAALPALCERVPASIPRLVIWGADDHINAMDTAKVSAFTHNVLVQHQAGHMPHVEKALVVNKALASLIQGE